MSKDNDKGGYCFDLLKEGLTDRDMSGLERGWFISVGLIGTLVVDPVLWVSKKLGVKNNPQDYDSGDSTHPFNQNY